MIQQAQGRQINTTNITMNAGNTLLLNGVTLQAKEDILGLAQNITVTNTQTQHHFDQ